MVNYDINREEGYKELNRRIGSEKEALKGLDVGLLDHLVVGKEHVHSMAVESDKLGVDSPLASNERYKESVIAIREKNKSYGKQLTLNTFVKDAGDER